MAERHDADVGGFDAPDPQTRVVWQPFPPEPPATGPADPRRGRWASLAALFAGCVGIVGGLLPAFDGQQIGDPDSVAFRIGLPLGLVGGVVAVALGARTMALLNLSKLVQAVAITALVVGSLALLLTAMLAFSG